MQRREFIGTVTGLAATAVVGGLPALAGDAAASVVGSPLAMGEFAQLGKCHTLFFEKLTGGTFRLKGCFFDEKGHFKHITLKNLTEDEAIRGRLMWRQDKHQDGKVTSSSVLDAIEISGGEYSCLECDFAFCPNPSPSPYEWIQYDPNRSCPRLPDPGIGG